jgi:hypothetical protein
LDSDSVLINRRRFILHPPGVKFNSAAVAGDSPTNAELEKRRELDAGVREQERPHRRGRP